MNNICLVDSHCHLDFPDFEGKQAEIVQQAEALDVRYMQTICTHMSKFPQVLKVAEGFGNMGCSVGIHPHEVQDEKTSVDELVRLAQHPKVIGVGETGLDYFYEHSPREQQQESFRIHIQAARELGLPVIVHTRDADEDTIRILQDEMQRGVFKGVIHCFSSSLELAQKSMEMGLYISISGIVTFKKAVELQEHVKEIPLEKMLVETDSPFLAPIPFRGKTNQPGYTRYVAQKVAELKDEPLEDVAKITTENFFSLFDKAKNSDFYHSFF